MKTEHRYRYMLEYAEPYTVQTELLKNRTHQTYRWKQSAMSDDLEALELMLGQDCRIVDQETRKTVRKKRGSLI